MLCKERFVAYIRLRTIFKTSRKSNEKFLQVLEPITLHPSHVIAPKWNPDDGALQTLQAIDRKSIFSFLSSSRPSKEDINLFEWKQMKLKYVVQVGHSSIG